MLAYRDAEEADLPAIVALLSDDPLGAEREDTRSPLMRSYVSAYDAIRSNPRQRLIVACDGPRIVGTLQTVVIPALSSKGSWHGQIEAVRISSDRRGQGRGEAFIKWAIDECRAAGCSEIQLLSHGSRDAAHRFFRRLGFSATHVGFKLKL